MDEVLAKKLSRRKHLIIVSGCIVLAGIVASFVLFAVHYQAHYRYDYDEIAKSGILRVIVEDNKMSFQDLGTDSVGGLQVKMVERFAEEHGLQLDLYKETDLAKAINRLLVGEVDVLAWHVPVYQEMKDKIAYTIPVFTSRQVLIQRKPEKKDQEGLIRNQLELGGHIIYVPAGTVYTQRLQNLAKEIGDTIDIREIPNAEPTDLFRMVVERDIDYTVCDEFVARVLKDDFPGIDMATAVSFTQNYSWCVHPEAVMLQDSLNAWLSVYLESKEYNKIYRQYTGVP